MEVRIVIERPPVEEIGNPANGIVYYVNGQIMGNVKLQQRIGTSKIAPWKDVEIVKEGL
jgi:hypothetical protein